MKGFGSLAALILLAACASDPGLDGPTVADEEAESAPKCPPGYYRMCELKQGDEFCECTRPMYRPSAPMTDF